jgi:hypothetical protein
MNSQDVLEFLQSNQNHQFKSYMIAKKFGVSTQTMTMTLTALGSQVQSEVNGKTRHWWIESDEVRRQKQARHEEMQYRLTRERPKTDNRANNIALERCKELYPNGGNFKSIC